MATRRIPVPKIEGSIPSGIISFLVFCLFLLFISSFLFFPSFLLFFFFLVCFVFLCVYVDNGRKNDDQRRSTQVFDLDHTYSL